VELTGGGVADTGRTSKSGAYTRPVVSQPPENIERKPVTSAGRILQGGPVALVTTHDRGVPNVLPVAWHTPLSSRPPLVGIALEQSRHSTAMIAHSEQFALNLPGRPLLHHVQYLGGMSGARIDKLEATQFETFPAAHLDAPLLAGCLAWVECEVQQSIPIGDHVLFVGLVVAVHVDPAAFDERWTLAPDARPLHFLGDHYYSALEGILEARTLASGDAPERVLAQHMLEELEQTREAQERRAELLAELQDEVAAGNVIDLSQVATKSLPLWTPPPSIVVPPGDVGSSGSQGETR
jgi:flavin reductase (DIM6/NTAB) family NADH-FMN oxidoreductase RutF